MRPNWPTRKVLARAFKILILPAALALAGFLIYRISRQYSLDDIIASASAIPAHRLLLAGGFAAMSYLCLTGFDWLALRYARRPLPYWKAALASFVSLSIGHNVGVAALSSGAIRYRFYSRWGLTAGEVVMVIGFCALTVALGLLVLGGAALLLQPGMAAQYLQLPRPIVIAAGSACLALAAAYVAASAVSWRPIRIRKWSIRVPPFDLAVGQVIIGPINFAFVAACLYQAMAAVADVSYLGLAAIYVIANVSSILSHVPGGLGVLESVVLFLTGGGRVIGALVVFRLVYYLVPLALGVSLLLLTEFLGLIARRR